MNCLSTVLVFGQTPTQSIRGTVLDEDTQLPLIGATVVVVNSEPLIGTTTDLDGTFRLEQMPIGRVSLLVSFIGYSDKVLPNIEVNSAKEVVLDIALVEASVEMQEVDVTATQKKGAVLNDLALVSSRSISAEQTSRYAGGFNDPSKITSNFAGVSNTQDGGNDIIVRGNSPKYIQWRLEGAEITNPNHFGDQNAVSGIVGALNNNLLSTSDFYTSAFPAEFGDALSGVYDVRMRKGNNEKFEGIFGLGLLGTDITLEGPFKKGYSGSYLVNFRYSTIALADDLGLVDVEGVNLKFQDAAFKFWLPTKKMGTFSIFGLQGRSSFRFQDVDPSDWVTPGNDFAQTTTTEDYDKGASLLNTGIKHVLNLSPKSYLKTTLLYSSESIEDAVFENLLAGDTLAEQRLNFNSNWQKSSYKLNSIYHHKLNARHKIVAGVYYTLYEQNVDQSVLDENEERQTPIAFDEGIGSLRSFVNWKFTPTERLSLVAGFHNTNILFNDKYTIEPRVALNYNLN
ncbi:MAG: carboxypeptidase-like regulatory domain-containing protein, partial [Phaeodactylibacter sp.]|nr:carboxypeptidase-like regulatory domain-containing protein [Phaeodactylibacter sp.]